MKNRPLFLRTIENAQFLRKNQTHAEKLLWQSVRNRRLDGMKFRRQYPFGQFVLDFFCIEHLLAIEVDGSPHDQSEAKNHDHLRDDWLAGQRIRVLRFSNHDNEANLPAVLDALISTVERPTEEGAPR
jgi:very-short-patch-repair endonuclease